MQIATIVAEDPETGRVVGAVAARVVCEGALILDPAWGHPRNRFRVVIRLMVAIANAAKFRGFKELIARAVGGRRWTERLVETCGWVREADPVLRFDLTAMGAKK